MDAVAWSSSIVAFRSNGAHAAVTYPVRSLDVAVLIRNSRSDEDEPGSGEEELPSSSVHVAAADPVRTSLDPVVLTRWQQI